ncbi:MAG TPA: ABC transporter permease [Spirochaetia bacterium]|nr:ABC transporter permease [Spirochaetales bacterium]HRY71861.1 ABC transporter permease [Spirochaetia bacterium]
MTASKLAVLSARSIFRNRMRSILTSLGIIIGVCSVIVMVAVGEGSQAQIKARISSMGTNLIMVMPPRGPREANRLSTADVKRLRAESSSLAAISGTVRLSAKVVGGSGYYETSVQGVEPSYLEIKGWGVESGDFFSEADLASRSKVAVLGATVAKELFGTDDPLGERVRIGATPFTVVGVLSKKGSSGMGDDQDDVVMVPLDTALTRLNKDRYINSIEASAVGEEFMDAAQAEVESILREAHRIQPGAEADFDVMNQAEIIATASETSKTLTTLLAAIAGVSLLVGGIGIMNIMLVSVTERTREIGIRMSVGARKRDILLQFLAESVILSLLGGLVGILLAVLVCVVLGSAGIPAIVNPAVVATSAAFAAAVGVFFGYYPARKASNLYPIDALRYE